MLFLVAGKYVLLLLGLGLFVRALAGRGLAAAGRPGMEGCHE